jgi:hypothetical protein
MYEQGLGIVRTWYIWDGEGETFSIQNRKIRTSSFRIKKLEYFFSLLDHSLKYNFILLQLLIHLTFVIIFFPYTLGSYLFILDLYNLFVISEVVKHYIFGFSFVC